MVTESGNKLRLFVAQTFPIETTRTLAESIERSKALIAPGLSPIWVPAANLHLTLRFLGGTRAEALPALAAAVGAVALKEAPFEARLKGRGVFPNPQSARILWVGVEAGESLRRLQRGIERAAAELGYEPEQKPFHPHVTVARMKGAPADVSHWVGEADYGAATLSEVIIYESRTQRSGAEYIARAHVPLGAHAEARPSLG